MENKCADLRDYLISLYRLESITGEWTYTEMQWLAQALADYAAFLGGVSAFRSLLPGLALERGPLHDVYGNRNPLQGGWNPGKVTMYGFNRDEDERYEEEKGLDYPTLFKGIVAHELTHQLVYVNPSLYKSYVVDTGWSDYLAGDPKRIPAGASDYARDRHDVLSPEDDMCDYVSFAIYQPALDVDVDHRLAIFFLQLRIHDILAP